MKRDKRVIVLSVVFFLLAATLWDRRLEYEKLLGGNHGIEQVSLVKNIPIKSEILWFELPALSWFVANRTNYISRLQGAGVVFSRDTAILYDQRTKNIGVFRELLDRPFELYWKHRPSRTKKIYEKILTTCCRSAQDLDFIVASYKVPEYQPLKILSLKNVRINYTNLINLNYKDFDWYLYNCKTINTLY